METFFALQAIGAGNSPVTGEFSAQRPVTRSFDVFCDLRQYKQLRKAGDLRCHHAHYDVIVMCCVFDSQSISKIVIAHQNREAT